MNSYDPVFLVISCRPTTDADHETDLIINDQHLVIEAIERTDMSGLSDAESDLKLYRPDNILITTHLFVLNLIQLATQRQDIEFQLLALGEKAEIKPSDSRVGQAFHWRETKTHEI
ncbi:hypothetical protein [Acinetobacter lwoffii]|uniref:hypothetical protein n=1 Tax=Acinetobacter lwoffii TaxID=28090 RepID=UPI002DBD4B45|nr:hypothetical protein [Acinetobacter lwoffii]MEB6679888.1 hypothetical protein [Acinetobacter lwoffii]